MTADGFTYDTNNRLTMYNNAAVYYDPDGNMVCSPLGEGFFDSSNRLTSFNTTSYDYDVENIRVRKTYGETVTTYTHNANSKLSQLLMKTENGVTTYYIYGLGLIYETTEIDCKVYHYDYRGSTVALTNPQGSVTDTFTYDTYGKLTTRTGTTATPFLYNGRDGVMSDENGLVYMRARYYSPTFKRFINADVVAGSITNAITLNRYAYANGNPVSNVDPFGLSPDERMPVHEKENAKAKDTFLKELMAVLKKLWDSSDTDVNVLPANTFACVLNILLNNFGAGFSTSSTVLEGEAIYLQEPLPITAETKTSTIYNLSSLGDSSKPISVYGEYDTSDPVLSAAFGLILNTNPSSLKINFSLSDVSISSVTTSGDSTYSFAIKANPSEFKIGFENSTSVRISDDITQTTSTNVSISGWFIIVAYYYLTSGLYYPTPTYAYAG